MKLSLPDIFNTKRVKALEGQVQALTKAVGSQKGRMKGYATEYSQFPGISTLRPDSRLAYSTLNKCYKQSSAVRPAVDGIVREITTLPFTVDGYPGKKFDEGHKKEVEALLNDPNRNKETFREILAKALTDMLIYDAGAIEKVKSPSGKLVELMARAGDTMTPVGDEHGVLEKYVQNVNGKKQDLEKDELIYMMLYPRAGSLWGMPIIESIVDEVGTLLYSNEHIAKSFTEDEIPPGVLNLGEIGKQAYLDAKEDFKVGKGQKKEFKLRVVHGTKDVAWIDFKRPNREMQLDELRKSIERIIFRNFGVVPIQLGEVSDVNRSTALIQMQIAQSRLIMPVVHLISYYVDKEIIQDEFGFFDVRFVMHLRVFEDEDPESRAMDRLVRAGIKSINQVCAEKGWQPSEKGGDRRFIVVGKRVLFVDELESMKSDETKEPSKTPKVPVEPPKVPAKDPEEVAAAPKDNGDGRQDGKPSGRVRLERTAQ